MPNDIAHFAIHADDCQRAKTFYEKTFGWTFEPWGPPNFWRIHTSPEAAVHGALQERRAPVSGPGMIGFECTVGVEAVKAAVQSIQPTGGQRTIPPAQLEPDATPTPLRRHPRPRSPRRRAPLQSAHRGWERWAGGGVRC